MSSVQPQLDLFDELPYYEGADAEYKSAADGLPASPVELVISPSNWATSPPNSAGSPPDSRSASPNLDSMWGPELLAVAAPVRGLGSAPQTVVRNAILDLCRGYVTSMVREDALELRYPEKPSHPDQAHRTRAHQASGGAA
jgi:hypothetical protein